MTGEEEYSQLSEYANQRRQELTGMLSPFIGIIDRYGILLCKITAVVGHLPPVSTQDRVIRDLMADVFDFLWEWRRPLLEGRVQVAYPLARRAYESISLLSICAQDSSFAEKWESGKEIKNAAIRSALAGASFPENEESLRELYRFFSQAGHPNRGLVGYRFLGEGNEFVLGSIGKPSLVLIADHFTRMTQLWFWFAAVVSYFFREVVVKEYPSFGDDYLAIADEARNALGVLKGEFQRLLKEETQYHYSIHNGGQATE